MASRSPAAWDGLSASQRSRYLAAGRSGKLTGTGGLSAAQVRRYYLNGGLMAGGRGHQAKTPISPRSKSRPTNKPRPAPRTRSKTTKAQPQGKAQRRELKGPARPGRSRDFDSLSPAQRKRYLAAGKSKLGLDPEEVRAYYESGKDLRTLRGHAPQLPKTAAPKPVVEKIAKGELPDDTDRAQLAKWRRSRAFPDWLPRDRALMSDRTAAALSQVGQAPDQWRDVLYTWNPDGTVTLTITPSTGYPVDVVLDREGVSEVGSWLRSTDVTGPDLVVRTEGYKAPGKPGKIAA